MSRSNFRLSYEISPILLIGGIAQDLPEQAMPILALTQQADYTSGMVAGDVQVPDDDYFAYYKVLPGSKLLSNSPCTFPSASQQVAANAIIANPTNISLLMIVPAKNQGGYISKGQIIASMKKSLDQHNAAGGLYTVATPAFTYTNCILIDLVDVSAGESKQVQYEYRWDFYRPLLTLEDSQNAYNSLMNKINGGLPVAPNANGEITWSGQQLTSDQTGGATLSTTGNQNVNPALINPAIQATNQS